MPRTLTAAACLWMGLAAVSQPALAQPAPAQPGSEAALFRDNIVIVLDASGSMNERMSHTRTSRMEAAKKALIAVARQVRENTQVGLIVFSAANLRGNREWVYDLGPVDRHKLEAAIMLPQPGGGTPLGAYIKKGADRLLAQRAMQQGYGTYRLLVVTDGIASDPNLVNKYLPDVLARGLVVDVIGVDMQETHPLATKVHVYRKANDPGSLEQALSEAFAEVGSGGPNDTSSKDDFEYLAAIPAAMAPAVLDALTYSANQPIGERAPPRPAPTVAIAGGNAPPHGNLPAKEPGPPHPASPAEPSGTFLPPMPDRSPPSQVESAPSTVTKIVGGGCLCSLLFVIFVSRVLYSVAQQQRPER